MIYAINQRKVKPTNVAVVSPSILSDTSNQNLIPSSNSSSISNNGQSSAPSPTTNSQSVNLLYRDGSFTGDSVDAYYGSVQVKAIIKNGKINDVQFLDFPQDRRTSAQINSQSVPALKSEAITAQSADVDIVSGATATSEAFRQSLQSALAKAKN